MHTPLRMLTLHATCQSIYGQTFLYSRQMSTTGAEVISGTLSVDVELSEDTIDVILDNEKIVLHYLPPISIEFTMIPRYPVEEVCDFSIQCIWLNSEQLNILKNQLQDIWNSEKNVVSLCIRDGWTGHLMAQPVSGAVLTFRFNLRFYFILPTFFNTRLCTASLSHSH